MLDKKTVLTGGLLTQFFILVFKGFIREYVNL